MKKTTCLYLFVGIMLAFSCRKDHYIFSQSPDERVDKAVAMYTDTLVNAPYGWRGFIFPSAFNGGVVSFYFKFNASNRVQEFSDFDSTSAVTMSESSYLVKAEQQIDLIFDTYDYVSVLADPDGSVNGGSYGNGLGSDIQFVLDTLSGDTLKMHGAKYNTKAYMVRATQQDATDFYAGKYGSRNIDKWGQILTYWKRVTVGSATYEIEVYPSTHRAMISWADGSGPHTTWTAYYYTAGGIGFVTPIVNGSQTLTELDNITWNASTLSSTVSVGGTTYNVVGSSTPINPNKQGFANWWNYPQVNAPDGSHGWTTVKGWHVNGVDDAYGISSPTNYYFSQYLPQYHFRDGGVGDIMIFAFVINNALDAVDVDYFTNPIDLGDGRARFTFEGAANSNEEADSVAEINMGAEFSDARGYYFVQTDATSYDMVGARDAKAWLSWFYY